MVLILLNSEKMHGDCYGEQIEFGDPHPTC